MAVEAWVVIVLALLAELRGSVSAILKLLGLGLNK